MILLSVGPHLFRVAARSYEEMERKAEASLAVLQRVGQHPSVQMMGPGEQTLTITGTLYAALGGSAEAEALLAEPALGRPLMLVTGTGRVLGRYVLRSVTQRDSEPTAAGVARRIAYDIAMVRYGA